MVVLTISGCQLAGKPGEPAPLAFDPMVTGSVEASNPDGSGPDRRTSGPTTNTADSAVSLNKTEFYAGQGAVPSRPAPGGAASVDEEGDITLNFVDAPVKEVVDVIIGDILKENYSIAAGVQGTVTTRTSAPLNRDDLIPILENLLALKGAALKRVQGVWHVVPDAEASRLPNVVVTPDRRKGGEAVHIIRLDYAQAESVVNVVSAQITPGRQLVADPERNLLIFVGPGNEARIVEDMVSVLDVDSMSDKLFALIPVQAAPAAEVVDDLEQVFDGSAGETIRFIPIDRLNAVLAIARQPGPLNEAQKWVSRFDRTNFHSDTQAFVYYVHNGRATELAKILKEVFYGEGSGGRGAVAPGLDTVEISADSQDGGGDGGDRRRTRRGDEEGPRIVADERNNALVITGTPEDYRKIEAILDRLDIIPLQVLIEVIVAEVSLKGELEHGVEWYFKAGDFSGIFGFKGDGGVSSPTTGFGISFESTNAKVVLSALDKVTDVDIVSSPKLMVLDNQSARLQVGDQVPVATQSAVSTDDPGAPIVNSVTLVDTGVILEVTPTVNTGGLVSLRVVQEVSQAITTSTSDIDSPTIQTRKIESTLAVHSGETAALAGLIDKRHERGETGVPGLRKIPVLGNLFKKKVKKKDRTELLVLITPKVVRDPSEMRAVTHDLKGRLPSVSTF